MIACDVVSARLGLARVSGENVLGWQFVWGLSMMKYGMIYQ